MPVDEKKKIEEQQQESGLQAQQPQAQWQPMQTKEMPAEASYSDLVNEAKDANKATFDSLRETSAKDLLNANIQTELAKVAASKQLSTKMNAMGLGNSGYAGVGAGQIQSAYMQGMQNNQATYQDALRDIAMKENELAREDALRQQDINREDRIRVEDYNDNVNYKNATMAYEDALRGEAREQALSDREATWKRDDEVAARDLANRKELISYENSLAKENTAEQEEAEKQAIKEENLVDAIAEAGEKANSEQRVNEVLNNSGIEAVREDGKFVLEGEGADNMSDSAKQNVLTALQDQYDKAHPPVNSMEDVSKVGLTTEQGVPLDAVSWGVRDEMNTLFNTAQGKALAEEGNIVKLQNNGNGQGKDWVYLQFDGGAWRKVSEADVDKSKVNAVIKGKDNISSALAFKDANPNIKTNNGKNLDHVDNEVKYLMDTNEGKALAKEGNIVYLRNGNDMGGIMMEYSDNQWKPIDNPTGQNLAEATVIKKGKPVEGSKGSGVLQFIKDTIDNGHDIDKQTILESHFGITKDEAKKIAEYIKEQEERRSTINRNRRFTPFRYSEALD